MAGCDAAQNGWNSSGTNLFEKRIVNTLSISAGVATTARTQGAGNGHGNNSIGVAVGAQANSLGGADTWGWIINQCQTLGQSSYLYGIGYDPSSRA